jgi:hypothetical protein
MRFARRLHLYLGCFFAPLLLLFVITGWYQTVTPHRAKTIGEQGDIWSRLTSIHVDQVYPLETVDSYAPALFQWLVIAMSISLIVTLLLGIYLAFRSSRRIWPVALCLAAGFLVPVLFLWLGHGQ